MPAKAKTKNITSQISRKYLWMVAFEAILFFFFLHCLKFWRQPWSIFAVSPWIKKCQVVFTCVYQKGPSYSFESFWASMFCSYVKMNKYWTFSVIKWEIRKRENSSSLVPLFLKSKEEPSLKENVHDKTEAGFHPRALNTGPCWDFFRLFWMLWQVQFYRMMDTVCTFPGLWIFSTMSTHNPGIAV